MSTLLRLVTEEQNDLLVHFENDMYDLIKNIKFKDHTNDFQRKLKTDAKKIQSSDMFVFADKTSNIYEMPSSQYTKLLHQNITKSHQKSDPSIKQDIDNEAKLLAESLDLGNKIERYTNRPAIHHAKRPERDLQIQNSLPIDKVAKQYLQSWPKSYGTEHKMAQALYIFVLHIYKQSP